jgi:hypothetical protein
VGNWKAILSDPNLKFDERSPVDLKDRCVPFYYRLGWSCVDVLPRFRTYFPDAYKLHYPNAKTHLSTKVRSTLPDGSSLFEKTRNKKRRPFTEEEDRALKAGYEKHGTVWATIVKDPIFQEQNRRSTDLRDRFRNAFPELYQAAGYKPRLTVKKKKHSDGGPHLFRAATDDQLAMSTSTGPIRRRRHTSQGLLRGGIKSVPQSTTCSEDEASSGEEDNDQGSKQPRPTLKDNTPQPEAQRKSSDAFSSMDMETIDPLSEPLTVPDFMHSSSQSEITDSQSQTWSSGLDTPLHSHAWSTAAGSPTSSHLSSDYLLNHSPLQRRSDGANMIGKSAWGTQDWFSANPRLDSSSNNYFLNDITTSPSSPFSFHNLNHGVLDRYDLFPTSFPNDFASEVGVSDTHSNYAGDLIFGARTHHPQQALYNHSSLGFGSGLGLSGIQHSAGIHPMQLHTPALPGIDEIELASITLNDHEDASREAVDGAVDAGIQTDTAEATMAGPTADPGRFGMQSLDDLVDLTELHATPPCTPVTQTRSIRMPSTSQHFASTHGRSFSVPPSEARSGAVRPAQVHANSQPLVPATRTVPVYHIDPQRLVSHHDTHQHVSPSTMSSLTSEEFRVSNDLCDLPFLDLHYYSSTNATGSMGSFDSPSSRLESESHRQGQALDLAQPHPAPKAFGVPGLSAQVMPQVSNQASGGPFFPPGRSQSLHHRVQSAVSPEDLFFRKGNDNKRKRASWDGGAF